MDALWPAISFVLLFFCTIATSVISAVAGIGGGVVLVALMTFFLPLAQIIPIHGLVQLVSNSSRTWFLKKHVIRPLFIFYVVGLPFGQYVGYFVIKEFNFETFSMILISLLMLYTVFKPKDLPPIEIPFPGFIVVGFVSGFLSLFIGATGPLLAPFLFRDDFSKEQIVSTKAISMMVTHIGKIPVFLLLDFAYRDHVLLIVALCVAAIIGTKVGVTLLKQMDEKLFRTVFKVALALAAVRLLYKASSVIFQVA